MTRNFVFDTNVLLSAMLSPRSDNNRAFIKAIQHDYLVYSEDTLAELEEKIYLSRLDKYVPLPKRLAFYYKYKDTAFPTLINVQIKACRDPKDDKFLELALSANADCIVTKDQDLLVLHPYEGVPILNVTTFLNRFY